MWFTAAFKILSGIGSGIAKFVRKYWMQIACFIFCVCLTWAGYRWGFNDADTKWIADNNKKVAELNKKIEKIESLAQLEAKRLKDENKILTDKLALIAANSPEVVAHDKDGRVLRCENKTITVYLGSTFTETWNKLNAESKPK